MKLVEFHCADHGYVCSAPATATVRCGAKTGRRRCDKRAVIVTVEKVAR